MAGLLGYLSFYLSLVALKYECHPAPGCLPRSRSVSLYLGGTLRHRNPEEGIQVSMRYTISRY